AGLHASLPGMRDIVPQADNWFLTAVVLEAQHADAGGPAEEKPPGARRQTEPAGRDHADDVGAGERQDVACDRSRLGDKAVGTGGHVSGRLTAGAAVAEHLPTGPLLQDVPGELSLVTAVIPLQQTGIDLDRTAETSQRARLRGALQRAGENASDRELLHPITE